MSGTTVKLTENSVFRYVRPINVGDLCRWQVYIKVLGIMGF